MTYGQESGHVQLQQKLLHKQQAALAAFHQQLAAEV
jgi:hypothetical protein